MRHLPGGIDEYPALASESPARPSTQPPEPQLAKSGAQRRAAEKELASVDRQLARLATRIEAKHTELAEYDQFDHVGVTRLTRELHALEGEVATVEAPWLELSEELE